MYAVSFVFISRPVDTHGLYLPYGSYDGLYLLYTAPFLYIYMPYLTESTSIPPCQTPTVCMRRTSQAGVGVRLQRPGPVVWVVAMSAGKDAGTPPQMYSAWIA